MIRIAASSMALALATGCTCEMAGPPTGSAVLDRFGSGEFVLHRLNGDRYPGEPVPDEAELLHGWEILEARTVTNPRDRARIFMAFEEGEEEAVRNPPAQVDCFQPRHAIRIVKDGRTIDHLICFECGNFMIWTDGEQSGGGSTTDHSESVFESYLETAVPGG